MNFLARLADISLLTYTQWLAELTLACLGLTILAFVFKWGLRFRLVGVTSFMGVITASVFALGLGLFNRVEVPGAIRYALVFDNAADKVTITLPPTANESEVAATLKQAALNLTPYGRNGGEDNQLTIRARTMLHPERGVSQPLYLGQAVRSLYASGDDGLKISVFPENIAQLSANPPEADPPNNRPAQYNKR